MSEPASVPDADHAGSFTPLGGLSGVTPAEGSANLINVRALLLGERLEMRGLEGAAPLATVILAGPTCDSADILYRRRSYELPLDLKIGDPVYSAATGAARAFCSAACTTDIVRNRLAALTLIESMPMSARKWAISG